MKGVFSVNIHTTAKAASTHPITTPYHVQRTLNVSRRKSRRSTTPPPFVLMGFYHIEGEMSRGIGNEEWR
jgi:hypothetical protein